VYDIQHPLVQRVEALMHRLTYGGEDDLVGQAACEHLESGGKRLRARLALASVEAAGLPAQTGVGWAAACELFHNATLIHDDIQDGDEKRRGKPTVWKNHGVAQAVNAGDLLFLNPINAILEMPVLPDVKSELCRDFSNYGLAVIRGQGAEISLRGRSQPTFDQYIMAAKGKTSALFALPVSGALRMAQCSDDVIQKHVEPFSLLGLAFQIQDDILDLYGDKGRGEKGQDVREGKISALVVKHLSLHPQDSDDVLTVLRAPRAATTKDEIRYLIDLFESGGALKALLQNLNSLRADAIGASRDLPFSLFGPLLEDMWNTIVKPIQTLLQHHDAIASNGDSNLS
jgi:geranylgeranyl diphosphate synthase, type I